MFQRKKTDREIDNIATGMLLGVENKFNIKVDWEQVADSLLHQADKQITDFLSGFSENLTPKDKMVLANRLMELTDPDTKKSNGKTKLRKTNKSKQH